jgi:hypothetical protein
MMLLLLLLLYVRLVIMNQVDLIFIWATLSMRCPDDRISFFGMLASENELDKLRSNCSQPYLPSSNDFINVLKIYSVHYECINKKAGDKWTLHLTKIHQSSKKKTLSISVKTRNPNLKQSLEQTGSSDDYTAIIDEKGATKTIRGEKNIIHFICGSSIENGLFVE